MSATSTTLTDLPPEILERIFINLIEDDPDHNPLPLLNSLMRTCQKLRTFVMNSTAIWKDAARKKSKLLHWESELRYGYVSKWNIHYMNMLLRLTLVKSRYIPTDLIRLLPRFRCQGLVPWRKTFSSDILRPKR